MATNEQMNTHALDLFGRSNRFDAAGRLNGLLHRWWIRLRKYGWAIVLIQLVVVIPVFILTLGSKPAYESNGRMWLTGRLDIYGGRLYTEELINYLGTQAELLRSPAIQGRALERLVAEGRFEWAPATGTDVTNRTRHVPVEPSREEGPAASADAPVEEETPFPFQVEVQEGAKSSTLDLRATGSEPASTRLFLDYLMEEYLSFRRQSREKTSDRAMTTLATEAAQLKERLEAQQDKLQSFQESNNVVFLQEQGNSAASYLASLNTELANLRTELRLLEMIQPDQWVEIGADGRSGNASSARAENLADEQLANLEGPQLALFEANRQIALLKATREERSQFLLPLHPKIIKLNDDIAIQERMVQVSREEVKRLMDRRRQAIQLQVKNLELAAGEWDARALEFSGKMADYERIQQNVQRFRNDYEKTLSLIQTVDVNKKVEQENIGVLEPASIALPTRPLFRNMALALAASMLLSCGLIYGVALFQDDFTSLGELSEHLSAPVLGQIPEISINETAGRPGIENLEGQRFELLESFRCLRSSIFFMGNGTPNPKSIVITSSIPQEGKSTVSLFLAATMARGNARVLLVDADMRRARLHKSLNTPAGPGLAEVLTRRCSAAAAIVPSGLENLSLLPAGRPDRNPGELALSPVWPEFLAEVQSRFDYVLVDTPPVLAVDDVSSLAPKTDGVLFIVRGSFTSARMARSALDALRQRQVRVLGLVLNRATSSPYQNHHYEEYRNAYRWEPATSGSTTMLAGGSAAGTNGS